VTYPAKHGKGGAKRARARRTERSRLSIGKGHWRHRRKGRIEQEYGRLGGDRRVGRRHARIRGGRVVGAKRRKRSGEGKIGAEEQRHDDSHGDQGFHYLSNKIRLRLMEITTNGKRNTEHVSRFHTGRPINKRLKCGRMCQTTVNDHEI